MQKSNFELENKLLAEGYDFVVGVDEAGRGPLAGPVVACAVTLRDFEILQNNSYCRRNNKVISSSSQKFGKFCGCLRSTAEPSCNSVFFDLIRDSKTLSQKQRKDLFYFIREYFYVGVGMCDHKTIDRINILEASFLAIKKAVTSLLRNLKLEVNKKNRKYENTSAANYIILLDGNKLVPNFSQKQKAIVDGDKQVKSISAASIIAKVVRDQIMMEMHKKYPVYGFDSHKGYGTKIHMDMLRKYGPCEIHRQSFKPVRNQLLK